MSAGERLALFDLDGTLLSGDTDALWCDFLVAEGMLDGVAFAPANREVVDRYARGDIDAATYCAFYAATLAGRTPAGWHGLRERFVADVVTPRLAASAHALVEAHRRAGDALVLTTATNRFLTEPIADAMRIDCLVATELELEGGVFTGRNTGVLNMQDGKLVRLRAWLATGGWPVDALERSAFYSDSINDLALLGAVGRPVVVDPDPRLRVEAVRRGWPVIELER